MRRSACILSFSFLVGCSSSEQAQSKVEDYVEFLSLNNTALHEATISQSENSSYRSFLVHAEITFPKDQLLPGEPGYESKVSQKSTNRPSASGGTSLDIIGGMRAREKEQQEIRERAKQRARRSLVNEALEKEFCSSKLSDLMSRYDIDQVIFILEDVESIQLKYVCKG